MSRLPAETLQQGLNALSIFVAVYNIDKHTNPDMNSAIISLQHHIQQSIRSRPFEEQFPEHQGLAVTLKKTSEEVEKTSKQVRALTGWQENRNTALEPIITNVALDHLRRRHPGETFRDSLRDVEYNISWNLRDGEFDIEMDGLIYHLEGKCLWLVEAKSHLDEEDLYKAKRTYNQLKRLFVSEEGSRQEWGKEATRLYSAFGGNLRDENPLAGVFLGYHSVEPDAYQKAVEWNDCIRIGPNGDYYKVYDD
ncbi:hypothetical protein SeMB42_g03728 [Synchytrium endobioticum]|uniref:Uncharacterized protein n=1 Tax=Synchytrium endobioticum TaxID=286115 RepID=A0A507D3W1_9FUNG|nr:hypothetical protein SeLEV6574_g03514 [Synchytrium endobioticum]TPX46387.1 hypothetical protein SeMB42_g03728 [Synchytrium endobioticum]